jgi:hypothetical protein
MNLHENLGARGGGGGGEREREEVRLIMIMHNLSVELTTYTCHF